MVSVVIDASVITKWYIKENLSEYAEKIREDYIIGKISLLAPSQLPYEVLNALTYSNLFSTQELDTIGESLENYGISLIPIINNARTTMVDIAISHKISIYDAAYIALSIENKIQFITADTKLKKKLPAKLKDTIMNLEDYNLPS
ncbi:MAG: type II toxin-antitoxin system VapC family toxin [Promethearchaeota archaeon]